MSKLDKDGVKRIADRINAGEANKTIAESEGVSQPTISQIRSGRIHRDVTGFEVKPVRPKRSKSVDNLGSID